VAIGGARHNTEPSRQVWSVKYNGEGNQVASVSDDKTINIYSIPV
jgi:WD repeat-containing protein 61